MLVIVNGHDGLILQGWGEQGVGEDGSRIQGTRLRNATGEMIVNQISCCVIIMIHDT